MEKKKIEEKVVVMTIHCESLYMPDIFCRMHSCQKMGKAEGYAINLCLGLIEPNISNEKE